MAISERVQTLRNHGYGMETAKLIAAGEDFEGRINAAETIIDLKLILHDIVDAAFPKADPEFMKVRAGMTGADR